jgi:hypothetical protein
MRPSSRLLALILLSALPACASDSTGPVERPEDALTILKFSGSAPPFEAPVVTFYARTDENREGRIYFLDAEGRRGEEFARLRVDAGSLRARPNGAPFAARDSILVTLRVVDPLRLLIELEPAGLAFWPTRPAELKLDYDFADPDFNGDGVVDARDRAVESTFAIWRQAAAGRPFVRLGTIVVEDRNEVEAELTGFSRYAIAY